MAPAQGYGLPAAMAPVIASAPADLLAPPLARAIVAVDLPPMSESVETIQPAPNSASGPAPSNVLTVPVVVAGFGAADVAGAVRRSTLVPPFQTPTISRVAVMSVVG